MSLLSQRFCGPIGREKLLAAFSIKEETVDRLISERDLLEKLNYFFKMPKICIQSPEIAMNGDLSIHAQVAIVTKAKLDEISVQVSSTQLHPYAVGIYNLN